MRIEAITVSNYPPLRKVNISGLSPDLIVFGGPNGSGKTRLISAIAGLATNQNVQSNLQVELRATSKEEAARWGKDVLRTADMGDLQRFRQSVQRQQKRGSWRTSLLYFDAQRRFAQAGQMGHYTFGDPLDEEIAGNLLAGMVENRQRDTTNAIVRLALHDAMHQRERMRVLRGEGKTSMPLDAPDPLWKFKEVFAILLGPKALADVDSRDVGYGSGMTDPDLYYLPGRPEGDPRLPFHSLSSGQMEVVLMAFDLLVHEPQDCVILIDEPELHLHPELSTRLFQTLTQIGARNQFIVGTHSPELISQGLQKTLVFLSPMGVAGNQGVIVRPGDENLAALRQLGENLGIISLGRNIVLVEGDEGSLDRATYSVILAGRFPEFALVPCSSRERMLAFESISRDVLDRSVWGLRFFMIGDRDNSLSPDRLAKVESESSGRLRFLKRYHLENYFLDENTLSRVFQAMEPPESWLREPMEIRKRLRQCAKEAAPLAMQTWANAYLRGRTPRPWPELKLGEARDFSAFRPAIEQAAGELPAMVPTVEEVVGSVERRWRTIVEALDSDTDLWKVEIPGKPILGMFAGAAKFDKDRLCRLYVDADRKSEVSVFQDILEVFTSFRSQLVTS